MTEDSNVAASSTGNRTKTGWGWIFAYGVLVILLGLLALVNPLVTSLAAGLFLGVMLLVYGVFAIAFGLSSLSTRARWFEIVLGVVSILAALIAIFNPFAGALSLVLVIGAWLFVMGLFEIIGAFRFARNRVWRLLLGVLDIVLGGLLLFSGPTTGMFFIALVVAWSLLWRGTFLVVLALGLRRIGKD